MNSKHVHKIKAINKELFNKTQKLKNFFKKCLPAKARALKKMNQLDNPEDPLPIFKLELLVEANLKWLLIAIKRNLFNWFINFSIRLISFKIQINSNNNNNNNNSNKKIILQNNLLMIILLFLIFFQSNKKLN